MWKELEYYQGPASSALHVRIEELWVWKFARHQKLGYLVESSEQHLCSMGLGRVEYYYVVRLGCLLNWRAGVHLQEHCLLVEGHHRTVLATWISEPAHAYLEEEAQEA